MKIGQFQKLSQSMVMTPQLQQAIRLLQMNRLELEQTINQELTENPLLEEVLDVLEDDNEVSDESRDAQDNHEDQLADGEGGESTEVQLAELNSSAPEITEELTLQKDNTEFDWESYLDGLSSDSGMPSSSAGNGLQDSEDIPSFENVLSKTTSLEDHLSWQLGMLQLKENELQFGEEIIGNLDVDGYFIGSIEETAGRCELDIDDAEAIHKMMKEFDPLGVTSRTLQECLLTQSKLLKPHNDLVDRIITFHLADLEKRNINNILKNCQATAEQIQAAAQIIADLEPKPARNFNRGAEIQYVTPDIYVVKVGDGYRITLNEDGMPKLRVSGYYKSVLKEAASKGATKEFIQEKLKSAVWLIRSIHNRQKTIYKVTESIVRRQAEFFEHGVSVLKPMVLREVAEDIGMHESTVSRVTTNKYVHTPVGIYELKYFFNSGVGSTSGAADIASEAVKDKIKQLVAKEDTKNPLSDEKISELLKRDGIIVARRTVAKYRDALGILPSNRRKVLG